MYKQGKHLACNHKANYVLRPFHSFQSRYPKDIHSVSLIVNRAQITCPTSDEAGIVVHSPAHSFTKVSSTAAHILIKWASSCVQELINPLPQKG